MRLGLCGRARRQACLVVAAFLVACATGCMTHPKLAMEATAYGIDVRLAPASHTIVGHTELELALAADATVPPEGPVAIELLLHPDLKITSVSAKSVEVEHQRGPLKKSDGSKFAPRIHYVILDAPTDALSLSIDYEGKLFQDVAAGEKEGEIHNFGVRAHVGEDGIYLGGGYWYPEPSVAEDATSPLADYTVLADPVADFPLVAGADPDAALSEETGRLAWRSPYPLDGMVLVGGKHEVHETVHHGVTIKLHLKPSQEEQVDGLFAAVREYLDRYEPLIGPYPAAEFAIVDNFFSSGFAFPTFTLLSSAVIDMGERSQTAHGYIDHEVLHCWWGNGVHVDPDDGNWCEALASYGANYYGHVLDGKPEEARRKRRNYAHFLSRLKPDKDKPLGTYGQDDGCGRGIAYNKGAAVFHMLARKIGQNTFWSVMRRLTAEYVGRYASWDDIRRLCEEESGADLETFFRQWVRSGGAPRLAIQSASYESSESVLTVSLSQGEPAFDLSVPIRITHAGGTLDVEVPLLASEDEVAIPVSVIPLQVEVDPDYHIFRKVPSTDIIPTTATSRRGDAFACVLPGGDVHDEYAKLQSTFESSFKKKEREVLIAGEIENDDLADRSLLILGDAVHDPAIAALLEALQPAVRFTDEGFEFDGTAYNDDAYGILYTFIRPGDPVRGVTVVYGNSDESVPKAFTVPFYDRSLIVFKDGKPIVRHDFEPRHAIDVKTP